MSSRPSCLHRWLCCHSKGVKKLHSFAASLSRTPLSLDKHPFYCSNRSSPLVSSLSSLLASSPLPPLLTTLLTTAFPTPLARSLRVPIAELSMFQTRSRNNSILSTSPALQHPFSLSAQGPSSQLPQQDYGNGGAMDQDASQQGPLQRRPSTRPATAARPQLFSDFFRRYELMIELYVSKCCIFVMCVQSERLRRRILC